MTRLLSLLLSGVIGLVPWVAGAQAIDVPLDESNVKPRITEVRVEGNRRVEAEAVRRALKNQRGRPFDVTATGDDLKALWSLNYFDDIQLLSQQLPDGSMAYIVRVTERPSVRNVKLTGNDELGTDDFKDLYEVQAYAIFDTAAAQRTARKMQDKYLEKGYFLAEVTWKTEPVQGSPEVDVTFVVNEHAKVMVKQINLVGALRVSADELKGYMQTREGGYLSFLSGEGTYKEEVFQRDLTFLQRAYYDKGFINVKVEKPSVSLSADKRFIFISIQIDEGESYQIGKIDFSGDLITDKARLAAAMQSREGDTFSSSRLGQDIQSLSDIYWDQGYAYANISPVTNVRAEERKVDLTFDVSRGEQVTIERIDIVGNTKTRDKVIRRQLRVYEGELFNGTGMRRSKERVTALGFFETVETTHKPGRDDRHVVVQVEVKEKSTGSFQVGAGFSNAENFILTAQVSQNNMLGWGVSASLSVQWSSLRQFAQASFYEPYLWDTDFNLALDLYRTSWDYYGFTRNATGGSANLGYYLLEDLSVNLGYMLESVVVQPGTSLDNEVPLANQFRNGATSALRLSTTWDKRNNRLFPSSGFMQYLSAEFAPAALGGSFLFNRYSGFSRFYVPLPLGIVFKTNLSFGVITQLDPARPLPISEMYFVGGINTVRGYSLRTISPTTLVGSSSRPDAAVGAFPIGGDKQVILNVELEFPIITQVGIRGVLFYDAGNAFAVGARLFEDRQNNLPLGVFHSVGFGLRWFSPIGPLRFEWGIPLTRRLSDQSIAFEFTIGNSF